MSKPIEELIQESFYDIAGFAELIQEKAKKATMGTIKYRREVLKDIKNYCSEHIGDQMAYIHDQLDYQEGIK